MIAKLLIHSLLETRVGEIEKILASLELKKDHPDVLWLDDEQKLGVEAAKKIRQYLSLKPYSATGRAVVVESAQNFTADAQNSLLKTLEEPPTEAIILLGADSDKNVLQTVLSRVQIVALGKTSDNRPQSAEDQIAVDVEKLLSGSIEQRFEYIEKLEDKEALLFELVDYFHQHLSKHPEYLEFTKELINAEEWKQANGNIRAILEYLMLKMPS